MIVSGLAFIAYQKRQHLFSAQDKAKAQFFELFSISFAGESAKAESVAESPEDDMTDAGDLPALPPAYDRASTSDKQTYRQSLQKMTGLLNKYATHPNDLKGLLSELKATHQAPVMTNQSNPYTGDLLIIRTDNPFPGTRYFRAQVFGSASDDYAIQHASFEFAPGKDSLNLAKEAVFSAFGNLGSPQFQDDHFISWKVNDQYNVWLRVLQEQDIKNSTFEAYTEDDIGTVKVALEAEVHSEME